MFISHENRKYLVRNFWSAVFLAVFAVIYEAFSHNVVSYYMIGAWLIPIVGAVPYILMEMFGKNERFGTLSRELWQLAMFTLALGSVIRGVIEIYGTTNKWTAVYLPVAAVLIAAAVIAGRIKRE